MSKIPLFTVLQYGHQPMLRIQNFSIWIRIPFFNLIQSRIQIQILQSYNGQFWFN